MIVDMTEGILAEHSTIEVVRKMEDDPKGYPDELWKQLAESGLSGLLIPESFGGGGQSLFERLAANKTFAVGQAVEAVAISLPRSLFTREPAGTGRNV